MGLPHPDLLILGGVDWHLACPRASSAVVVGFAVDCAEVGLIHWSSMVLDFLHRLVLNGRLTASG